MILIEKRTITVELSCDWTKQIPVLTFVNIEIHRPVNRRWRCSVSLLNFTLTIWWRWR